MVTGYKRIKILSEAEINDLYSLPKFTLEEKIVFFTLNKKERQFVEKIPDISSKVHAILQLVSSDNYNYLLATTIIT